jgi:hypothetical protein
MPGPESSETRISLDHWGLAIQADPKCTTGVRRGFTFVVEEFCSPRHEGGHHLTCGVDLNDLLHRGLIQGLDRRDLATGVGLGADRGFFIRREGEIALSPVMQALVAVEYLRGAPSHPGAAARGAIPVRTLQHLLHLLGVEGIPCRGIVQGVRRGLLQVVRKDLDIWVEVRPEAAAGHTSSQTASHAALVTGSLRAGGRRGEPPEPGRRGSPQHECDLTQTKASSPGDAQQGAPGVAQGGDGGIGAVGADAGLWDQVRIELGRAERERRNQLGGAPGGYARGGLACRLKFYGHINAWLEAREGRLLQPQADEILGAIRLLREVLANWAGSGDDPEDDQFWSDLCEGVIDDVKGGLQLRPAQLKPGKARAETTQPGQDRPRPPNFGRGREEWAGASDPVRGLWIQVGGELARARQERRGQPEAALEGQGGLGLARRLEFYGHLKSWMVPRVGRILEDEAVTILNSIKLFQEVLTLLADPGNDGTDGLAWTRASAGMINDLKDNLRL